MSNTEWICACVCVIIIITKEVGIKNMMGSGGMEEVGRGREGEN